MTLRRLLAPATALAVAGVLLPVVAAADDPPGRVGPSLHITGNGRALHPVGDLIGVGNFPTASALTPDGRFDWVADSGHGKDDVQVVDVAAGKVVQTLPLPGAFGGVAFTPDGRRAYVSGAPAPSDTQAKQTGTKGDGGDVVHVFDVAADGRGTERDPIALPASSGGAGQQNSLPPVQKLYPAGLSVSPDGRTVAVALQQADRVALITVATGAVRTVQVGRYPSSTAFDRTGRAYVSNAYDGTVSAVDVDKGSVVKTIAGLGGPRGDQNAQPEGMVADPKADRLYVAVTLRDTVAVIDTQKLAVTRSVAVGRTEALGAEPVALAVDPEGQTLYAANANEDSVAVVALTSRADLGGIAGAVGRVRTVFAGPSVATVRSYLRAVAKERIRDRRALRRAHSRTARRREVRRHVRRRTVLTLCLVLLLVREDMGFVLLMVALILVFRRELRSVVQRRQDSGPQHAQAHQ